MLPGEADSNQIQQLNEFMQAAAALRKFVHLLEKYWRAENMQHKMTAQAREKVLDNILINTGRHCSGLPFLF